MLQSNTVLFINLVLYAQCRESCCQKSSWLIVAILKQKWTWFPWTVAATEMELVCHSSSVGGFRPPSATVVSAEPFSRGTGTLRCLQKEMATYKHWSVSLWRDPDDVSHCRILSPDKTEWQLLSATLRGWRRCFVADQLWFMTHIREEENWKWHNLIDLTWFPISLPL